MKINLKDAKVISEALTECGQSEMKKNVFAGKAKAFIFHNLVVVEEIGPLLGTKYRYCFYRKHLDGVSWWSMKRP